MKLLRALFISGFFAIGVVQPGWAQTVEGRDAAVIPRSAGDRSSQVYVKPDAIKNTPPTVSPLAVATEQIQLSPPATAITDWTAQLQEHDRLVQALIQITDVRLNSTEAGLEVILETIEGQLSTPTPSTVGNALIADISNATLTDNFTQTNPIAGITRVDVTALPGNRVRVAITGTDAPPSAEIRTDAQGLVVSVVAGTGTAETEEAIEIVVTGEQEMGYSIPDASTATRTDTPLRDIPQSIQVIPQQVIEDQGVTRIEDALRNVSGVTPSETPGTATVEYNIRGFEFSRTLRNGFEVPTGFVFGSSSPVTVPNNIERVEVLKGPASVLYGQVEPGGVVNYVTKKPLSDPYYAAEFTVGSYSFYAPSIDLSGPLTNDKRLLYRFNASYQNYGSFLNFVNGEVISIAPAISYKIGDATNLAFEYEYSHVDQSSYSGLPLDPISFKLPISRNLNEPDDRFDATSHTLNLTLEHGFNDNLSLRTALGATFSEGRSSGYTFRDFDPITNEWLRSYRDIPDSSNYYSWRTDLIAKFNTGAVQHQFLLGLELTNTHRLLVGRDSGDSFINVLDPIYGESTPALINVFDSDRTFTTVGIYLQDQVTLLPNLKLLIGGRYDFANSESQIIDLFEGKLTETSENTYDEAFSPRLGLVYQPIEPISLYASFSRSFVPNYFARTRSNEVLKPTRGTQYEVGIKAEFGNLAATLAAYQITKTNIPTEDPEDPDFSIAVGEVRSRGIEFDIGGEILPGWNIIASAFLNEAIVSEDNNLPVGDELVNAPSQGASLWTTYEIQSGNLQGLGFGVGVFFVGDREGELPNDFVIPSYVRADAALFYKRENWEVGLNFKNLFDTRYYESGDFNLYPGEPFTVLGTVSVRF